MNNIISHESIKQKEDLYTFEVYPKRNIVITRAKNATIWDNEGKTYIDCASGIGVANIGHSNDLVIDKIKNQLEKLVVCPGIFYNDIRANFLEKLLSITPKNLKKVFLSNSGTEAIEAAIKFARYTTKKTEFIVFNRAFHGRTMGSLSATFEPKYREDFKPLVEGFYHVPFNNFVKLLEKITDNTAGIILELIQGEGGVNIANQDFVTDVRRLCNEKGIILIIDEIQTGFGRTGEMFACSHFGLEPDILCLAKSIAGGIPMGATVVSDKVKIDIGKHGSTFGGNPLACAAGIATIDFMLNHDLPKQSKEKGKFFVDKLIENQKDIPIIRNIRNLGLMIGIELKTRVKGYIELLMNTGIIAMPAGKTVLRLLPPLTIEYNDINKAIEILVSCLKQEIKNQSDED
jgi:acetylornithine/LysW-gamma-L-lysine aminotransferase